MYDNGCKRNYEGFSKNQIKQFNHEIITKNGYAKTWEEEFKRQVAVLEEFQSILGDMFNKDLLSKRGLERLRNDLKELYKYEEEYYNQIKTKTFN